MAYEGPSMDMNGESGGPLFGRFPPATRPDPQRLVLKTRMDPHSSSPVPPGSGHPILYSAASNGMSSRRPRPETSHQKAVNINRKMRIDHILHKQILAEHDEARREKRKANSSFGMMVMKRVRNLPDMYDTEDEYLWGPGGLMPNPNEAEDFGEEALAYKKAIDRAMRRLYREENRGALGGMLEGYRKRKRKSRGYPEDEEKDGRSRKRRRDGSRQGMRADRSRDEEKPDDDLDDLDRALLGEGGDDDQDEEDSDDSEGEDGDITEEDACERGQGGTIV